MISRTAQVVALAFFRLDECTFRRPTNLTDQMVKGLEELEKAKLITISRTKRDGWVCRGTETVKELLVQWKAIDPNDPADMFRVMKS